MPIENHTAYSTARILERTRGAVERLLAAPVSGTACLPVYVITGTPWANSSVSRDIAAYAPFGVKTTTFHSLLDELCSLFTSVSRDDVASPDEIAALMEPIARKATGRDNASTATAMLLARFISDSAYVDDAEAKIAASPLKAARVAEKGLEMYRAALSAAGKLDFAGMMETLLSSAAFRRAAADLRIVVQAPDPNDQAQSYFYEELSELGADIVIIRKKYDSGFSFPAPLAGIEERFVEVYGHHALGFALGCEASRIVEKGSLPGDIIITMKDTSSAEGEIVRDLTGCFGFAVALTYIKPVVEHPYGNALFVLLSRGVDDYAVRWKAFLASPFSGIAEEEMRIAEKSSSPEEALFLLAKAAGYEVAFDGDSGQAFNVSELPDELKLDDSASPFIRLCSTAAMPASDETAGDKVDKLRRLLSENCPAGIYDEQDLENIDNKFRDYADICSRYGLAMTNDQLMRLTLRIRRIYHNGEPNVDQDDAILITNEMQVPFAGRKHVLMCDLDMSKQSSYLQPSAFHQLEDELGMKYERWSAQSLSYVSAYDAVRSVQEAGGSVSFIYETRSVDGVELPHSAILDDLMDRYDDESLAMRTVSYSERESAAGEFADARHESREIVADTTIGEQTARRLLEWKYTGKKRNSTWSPTEIEEYWKCPYRWFLSLNGAGYSENDEPGEFSPRKTGSLVHSAMEIFYNARKRNGRPARITASEAMSLSADIEEAVNWAIDEYMDGIGPGEISDPDRFCHDAKEQLEPAMQTLLSEDLGFAEGYSPAYMELRVSEQYAGATVVGTIDRVDVCDEMGDDGRCNAIIVDYKGKLDGSYQWSAPPDGQEEPVPPLHIQAALYANMLEFSHPELRVIATVYRSYKGDGAKWFFAQDVPSGITGVDTTKRYGHVPAVPYDTFRQALTALEQQLAVKFDSMRAGDIPKEPYRGLKAACQFCPMQGFCEEEVL